MLDLTPFDFTPTESHVYEVLITKGPGTGYAIARAAGLARANAYSALEGLVAKGAARAEPGRPRRYRPEAPQVLLGRVVDRQSLAMVAAMPMLRRERAAFTERLGQYLSTHAPKRAFVIQVGKKSLKPTDLLLGDPTEADSKGNVPDIPFALVFYEQIARIGALAASPMALKVLSRLEQECDASGVWRPKKLAAPPKTTHAATYHAYPLNSDERVDSRLVDVTFRLALIAKVSGRPLEYT